MRTTISPEYAALNRQLHDERDDYGSDPAEAANDAAVIVKFVRKVNGTIILDFGCGKGMLRPEILKQGPEMTVFEYDPAIEGKGDLPAGPIDVIVGMDVMEHIEAEYIDNVLDLFQETARAAVILKIALTPALKLLPDGRNAHVLLRSAEWWMEKLQTRFTVRNAKNHEDRYLVFVGLPIPKA